ncbi:MAG: 8-oxo-dGTP diphosphatase [Bacillota bacterium]|nr:8-oxo-dGTP diphosphatase [Bacillota bacterium]
MDRKVWVTLTNMCMVYDHEGNVLVQERLGSDWPGITFPGGHVETNESLTDAVIREIYEETGLRISSPRLCGVKDWIEEDGSRYIALLYRSNQFEGELHSSPEGPVYWVKRDELPRRELAPDMDSLLGMFMDGLD